MSSLDLEEEAKKEKELYLLNVDDEGMNSEESNRTNLSKEIVSQWHVDDVIEWATKANHCTTSIIKCLQMEGIDGQALLSLTEDDIRDFRYRCNYDLRCGEMKRFWHIVRNLQFLNTEHHHHNCKAHHRLHAYSSLGYICCNNRIYNHHLDNPAFNDNENCLTENCSLVDGCATNIPPEFSKTAISLGYSFVVTWITSFVMVIVHERVPDMKRYPPLPDIFLDNVPHIPWAFHMCEITGTLLFIIWAIVCIFHKYRMVILRRFFALAGTVFLLRCVTMLITSLSVPGTHLQCNKNDYAIDDTVFTLTEALYLRISRAYTIWSGLGMSIQGVRTCGDYMFSGHTVALTLLNFFITEYTPRNLYFLHTLSWLLNMFGIFFILAAHEHYSIDVFVAFYITSRLFLYYHTLANNQALMQRDSNRTRIWFPMFSYFESSVNGIIPNEYESLDVIFNKIVRLLLDFKDLFLRTANRIWLEAPALPIATSNGFNKVRDNSKVLLHNATTSTSQIRLRNISTIKMESWSSESVTVRESERENFSNPLSAAQLDCSTNLLKPVIKNLDSTTSDINKQTTELRNSKGQLELRKLAKDDILYHAIATNSNSSQNAIPASRLPPSPDVSKKLV